MANTNLPRDAFEFNPIARVNLFDFVHEGLRRFDTMCYGPQRRISLNREAPRDVGGESRR
jgi:hypothetical protein